jgi:hypothetical protein
MLKSDSVGVLRRLGVLGIVSGLMLAACGGDDEGGDSGDEDSRDSGTLTQVSPLTGLEAPDGFPKHPVIVGKIDNTSSAEPQVGLDKAELIVEELVEGGSTRLASFFWTQTPNEVGPVRSMRSSDVGIVGPVDGVLVASGGAPTAVKDIQDADIETFTEGAAGYSRDSSRIAPYNLMMNLEDLAGTLKEADAPGPYLPFGGADDFAGTKRADSVDVEFSSGHTTSWSYEKGTGWVREDSIAEQGEDFVPDNLLTLEVKVGDAGYLDPAGNPVPETKFFGKGKAVLFHDGKALPGTWSKDGADGQLELTTTEGKPLTVPAGHTWIELVPKKGGSVSYGR